MATELIDLSSGSDSDEGSVKLILYSLIKRKKSRNSEFMKKRMSYGEFALTTELSEKQFTNYFHLNRYRFHEVLHVLKGIIFSEGRNVRKLVDPEEKPEVKSE
jgi:hypothetical protein